MRRWLIAIGALGVAAAGGIYFATSRGDSSSSGGGRIARIGGRRAEHAAVSGAAPYSFCAQLAAGDEVGNWGCYAAGDASNAAGAPTSFSAIASPTLTASGVGCAAGGYATLNGSTQYLESATISAPAGDWSICTAYSTSDQSNAAWFAYGNNALGAYGMTSEGIAATEIRVFMHAATETVGVATSVDRAVYCLTYKSSDGTTTTYQDGAPDTPFTATPLTDPGGDRRWFAMTDGLGSRFTTGKVFLVFVTEKQLSGSDVTRLTNAWGCH